MLQQRIVRNYEDKPLNYKDNTKLWDHRDNQQKSCKKHWSKNSHKRNNWTNKKMKSSKNRQNTLMS